jgi:hypothetical protein
MTDKILKREWLAIGIVIGAILTTIIISKISQKKVYNLLERAKCEAESKKDAGSQEKELVKKVAKRA